MPGYRPKTNGYCPYNTKDRCTKTRRLCSNKSNFYEECNAYIGNKSLAAFL